MSYRNITDELDYVSIDDAIANLEKLREEHGGKTLIDVSIEREPYSSHEHAVVQIILKD